MSLQYISEHTRNKATLASPNSFTQMSRNQMEKTGTDNILSIIQAEQTEALH